VQVVGEDEPDNQNIDVEEQRGYLDIGVISGYICGERYEDNRYKQEDGNPEQMGIDIADEMELAVMIQPESCENQKSENKYKDFRQEIENLARKDYLSLGYLRFWGINTKHEDSHRDGKDTIDHGFQPVF
jgi:hypothetical protein